MMRKINILLIFILFFNGLSAQIEDEIKSFNDSTIELVENGRRMILQNLVINNTEKSNEVYNYLVDMTRHKGSLAFTYNEDLYINLIMGNWEKWLDLAEKYNSENVRVVYPTEVPFGQLGDQIIRDSSLFNSKISDSKLSNDEDRKVIDIYWYYIKKGDKGAQYAKKLKLFYKAYPDSRYNDFLKLYMPKVPGKFSYGFSVGILESVPDNLLANSFSPTLGFYFSMDLNIQRVFSSLYLQGSSPKLQTPFSAISGMDTLNFRVNEGFNHLSGGLLLGYFVLRNQRFHIAPFFTMAGVYIRSNRFDPRDKDNEVSPVSSFVYGLGLHLEAKLLQFQSKSRYYSHLYYQPPIINHHLSFKTEFGYDINARANISTFKGNFDLY